MRLEWAKRALRTFVQAALGYAAANALGVLVDGEGLTKNALGALFVASVAAGIAALMNIHPLTNARNATADVTDIAEDDFEDFGEDDGENVGEELGGAVGESTSPYDIAVTVAGAAREESARGEGGER